MSKNNRKALTAAFEQATEVIQSAFVEGSAKSACRNGGWHINQVEKKDYGLSVTPVEFVPESAGVQAYKDTLQKHRQAYANKLLKN
jgi:hypothetical protein